MKAFILIYGLLALTAVTGAVSNIVWLFKNFSAGFTPEFLLALVGVPVAPIGIVHGLMQFF
jgi:hypothetical protein